MKKLIFSLLSLLFLGVMGLVVPVMAQVDYYYEYDYAPQDDAFLGLLGFFYLIYCCGVLFGYILMAVIQYKLAKRLEVKDNLWFAFVPILNFIQLLEMAELEMWMIVFLFIPVANLVIIVLIWYKIILRFRKPEWHIIFIFLPLINIGYLFYLAFMDEKQSTDLGTTKTEELKKE